MLQRDGVEDVAFRLDFQSFLSLHGSLQAAAPFSILHDTAGKFIHQFHLPVADDVVDILATLLRLASCRLPVVGCRLRWAAMRLAASKLQQRSTNNRQRTTARVANVRQVALLPESALR